MPKKAVKPQELSVRLQPIVSARTAASLEGLMKSWNTSIGKVIDILIIEDDAINHLRKSITSDANSDVLVLFQRFMEELTEIDDVLKLMK